MKKTVIITMLFAALLPAASFGFASFDGVKTNEHIKKYLMEKLQEAKDKQDEENGFAFAPWRYNIHKYAQEFRSEISTMDIRVQGRFFVSDKYKQLISTNEAEKSRFNGAVQYYSMITQFSRMQDESVVFYALTLYDVNQMDPSQRKDAEKYLANNEKRFKSFEAEKSFRNDKENAKLVYVMARLKKVNRILGNTASGDGNEFINFCALLSQVFK